MRSIAKTKGPRVLRINCEKPTGPESERVIRFLSELDVRKRAK
jgi:hypothetical protein